MFGSFIAEGEGKWWARRENYFPLFGYLSVYVRKASASIVFRSSQN